MNPTRADAQNSSVAPFAASGEFREELRQFLSQAQRRLESIQTQLAEEHQHSVAQRMEVAVETNNNESRLEDSLLGALPQAADSFPAAPKGMLDSLIEATEPPATAPQQNVQLSGTSNDNDDDQSQDRLQAIKLRLQQQLQKN